MPTPAFQRALDDLYARYESLHKDPNPVGETLERTISGFYELLLEPGDTAFDLGANVGRHTFPLARCVGPSGLVAAFEPIPACIAKLEQRIAAERLSDRIELHRVALARERGTATFYLVDAAPGHSGLRPKGSYPRSGTPRQVSVETVPLDEFIPVERRVRFLKADLEGGEFHALQGGRRLLAEHRPVVVFESAIRADSARYDYSVAEFFAFFGELGFELSDILGCPFHQSHALRPYPFYLVAYPREDADRVRGALSLAVLERFYTARWFEPAAHVAHAAAPPAELAERANEA